MENIEKYQKQLLEQTQNLYRETPISEGTQQAYLATPRHRFVRHYREWGTKEWQVVEPESLVEHIATLYCEPAINSLRRRRPEYPIHGFAAFARAPNARSSAIKGGR